MAHFIFKDKNSKDFDIIVEHMPQTVIPEATYNSIEIPGALNKYRFENHAPIQLTFSCYIKNIDHVKYRNISKWLSKGEGKLIKSNEPDFYYVARVVNAIPLEQILKRYSRFKVTFECQPYARTVEPERVTITGTGTVNNVGSYDAYPYMRISGNGNFTIRVNGVPIEFKNVAGFIEVDCESMECFQGSSSLNINMFGDYPVLKVGNNTIDTGGATSITITTRWRY